MPENKQKEVRTGKRRQREKAMRKEEEAGVGVGWTEKARSERENGKEEEHLSWPGNLGEIAESVGDFLLCFFFAMVTLLPCGAHGDNMCDE